MSLSSHQSRLLTAGVIIPLVLGSLYLGGWFVFALVTLVTLTTLWEFYGMFWPVPRGNIGLGGNSRWDLKLIGLIFALIILSAANAQRWIGVVAALVAAFWFVALRYLLSYSRHSARPYTREPKFADTAICMAGLIYIPLVMQGFLFLSWREILLVLLATFLSDTGGYYAGVWFGKHKVWPSVSPKKTWIGSLGSLGCCALCVLLVGEFLGPSSIPWPWWLALGLVLNLAAQLGDFVESALKRSLDVKDSGRLLPGHGGVLDRVDGLLFVLPVYAGLRSLYPLFSQWMHWT